MTRTLKVCLVSRHYPPAVAGGSRRPFFLARSLAEAGADVCVVAPDADPALPSIVVPHANRDPGTGDPRNHPTNASTCLRNTAREWLMWPDPDIRWAARAAESAAISMPFQPDWVLTTSPPESIHWVGSRLKKQFGCRWIADFRDQWFERSFRKVRHNPVRRMIEYQVGRAMLAKLDAVTAVNRAIAQEIRSMAPRRIEGNTLILPHFTPPLPPPIPFKGAGFHLVHAGSFSLSDPACSIAPVLKAFAEARAVRSDIKLHLIGRLTDAEQAEAMRSACADAIVLHGVVPLEQSLGMQLAADALIVAAAPQSPVPPGKLAECLGMGKPVIAFGSRNWRLAYGLGDEAPAIQMQALETLSPPVSAPDQRDWLQVGEDLIAHLSSFEAH